jgi:hypothetical protein
VPVLKRDEKWLTKIFHRFRNETNALSRTTKRNDRIPPA